MIKKLNLKEGSPSIEDSCALIDCEIENCKHEKIFVIKILHGYGSSGKGGVLLKEVRKYLAFLKRTKIIKNFLCGEECSLYNLNVQELLKKNKEIFGDKDLLINNPGITFVLL